MIEIPKKDFVSHISQRYKGLSFQNKLVHLFFPRSGDNNKKIRFNDFYRTINMMLEWSHSEQLGFCFYLFDNNEDGFICIQDMFHLLRELNDQDYVLREDVNKMINILKEKGKRLRKNKKISPIIYGIYNKYESQTNEQVIFNDYLAKESDLLSFSIKKDLHPMVWDKTSHKLHPYNEPQTLNNSSEEEEDPTTGDHDQLYDYELETLRREHKARKKLIKARNQDLDTNFIRFVQGKYQKLKAKQRYIEVQKSEIEQEFNTATLTNDYMKTKKFKDALDYI